MVQSNTLISSLYIVYSTPTISKAASFAQSVFAADVDGDGHIDVLSASERGDRITWYENAAGDGSAWSERVILEGADEAPVSVFAADVNGDDEIDVVAATRPDRIVWLENDGQAIPTFTEHEVTTNVDGARSVYAADLDVDDDLDLFSASTNDNKIAMYRQDDDDTFTEILVSDTVRSLVAGSGIEFADRGSASLRGVPEEQHLFAVEGV